MVVVAGAIVKPDCEAASPSPEAIDSDIPGIPDIAGVVETGDAPDVLVAVRLEVPVLQAARNTETVTTIAAATKLLSEISPAFITAAYLPLGGINLRTATWM